MAGADIYYSVGAETGALEAAVARTKAQMTALAREMTATARTMQKDGSDMDSALGSKLKSLGADLAAARARMAELKGDMSGLAAAANDNAAAVEGMSSAWRTNSVQMMEGAHVARALVDSIIAGQDPLRAFAMEGGRLAQIFSMSGLGMGALAVAAGIGAAAAAMGYFVLEAMKARDVANSLKGAMAFSNKTTPGLDDVAGQINAMKGIFTGISGKEAEEIAVSLRRIQAPIRETLQAVIAEAKPLADVLKKSIPEAVEMLVSGLESADAAMKALKGSMIEFTEAERERIKAAQSSGDPHKMQAAFLGAIADATARANQAKLDELDTERALLQAQEARNAKAGKTDEFVRAAIRSIDEEKLKILDADKAAQGLAKTIEGTPSSVQVLTDEFKNLVDSILGAGTGIEDLQSKMDKLRAGLGGGAAVSGAAASFLGARAGGSDVSDLSGEFGNRLQAAIAAAEAATGARAVISSGFRTTAEQARIYAEHQAMPGGLAAHPAAPPGSSLHEVGAAADLGPGAVLDWLHAHAGEYGLEFLPGQTGINDPGHIQIAGGSRGMQALGRISDQAQAERDRAAGGSVVDKQALDDQQKLIDGKHDDIKAEEEKIAALTKQRDLTADINSRRQLESQINDAQIKKQQLITAAKEAEMRLDTDRSKRTDDPAAAHEAAVKLAQFRMEQARKLHGEESAEYKQAMGEKMAADDRYEQDKRRLSARDIEGEIEQAKNAAAIKRDALEAELAQKRISSSSWLTQMRANAAQEEAALRSLYAREIALAGQSADEKKRLEMRLQKDLDLIRRQAAKDSQKSLGDQRKAVEGYVNDITGPLNSALRGLISGHQTLRDAAVSAFEGIGFKMLEVVEKNVAAWIAGLATQKAMNTAAISKDAGRAAAGAFAATAEIPIIGPALAPAAAAAAFAATEAFAAYDIGAWSIPNNQLAMVHKNELIMPAAEAGAFRSMLTAAASDGGRGGGGATHNHTWNVSGQSSPRETAREIARLWDREPSLRPSY